MNEHHPLLTCRVKISFVKQHFFGNGSHRGRH
ncbi:Uncharacterised protein [Vibrio cholerae]|nr:Uncharacterised protein [Vibrio cholerae]